VGIVGDVHEEFPDSKKKPQLARRLEKHSRQTLCRNATGITTVARTARINGQVPTYSNTADDVCTIPEPVVICSWYAVISFALLPYRATIMPLYIIWRRRQCAGWSCLALRPPARCIKNRLTAAGRYKMRLINIWLIGKRAHTLVSISGYIVNTVYAAVCKLLSKSRQFVSQNIESDISWTKL